MAKTNRLNRVNFASADIQSNEQTQEITAEYEDVSKPYIVTIPRRIERAEGWQDVEILKLQKDRNGLFPARYVCQIVGNEDERARFCLSTGKASSFMTALINQGIISTGDTDLLKLVGTKLQILFCLNTLEFNGKEKTCYTVEDVQEFVL